MQGKLGILFALAMMVVLALPALADNAVNATVTPGVISVNVSPTSVNYGVLLLSESNLTRTTKLSSDVGATFTATAGSLPIDINITGAAATAASEPDWALISTPADIGAVATNQYVHRVDEGNSFASVQAFALSTSPLLLSNNVAGGTSRDFILEINMPTGASSATGVRSTTVTLTATACGC